MTGDEYAKYLKGLGHVDDASALGKVDYEEVLRVRKEGASRAKSNNFKGTLKGKEIELPNVSTKQVTYTKRNPVECTKLRNRPFNFYALACFQSFSNAILIISNNFVVWVIFN